jgi:glycosyltransferase domain-containing protein
MNNRFLSKLTLIIPTYNRQLYAQRSMRYWSGQGVTVHVMDGSPLPISPGNLDGFAENIHYHHVPVSVLERLEMSLEMVATEYVAIGGDDEFYIPSGLGACISELDAQPDLVSCMGRCLGFEYTAKGVTGGVEYLRMEDYSILQSDPIDRMVAHMNPYTCSTIYSVIRSPVWQRSFLTFLKKEFPVYAIAELQIELAISYQGKSRVLPVLMWMRSGELPPTRREEPSLIPENTFENWWLDPAKETERAEFLAIMGNTLAEDGAVAAEISAGVKMALDAYLCGSVQERSDMPRRGVIQELRARAVRYLPAPCKSIVKSALRPFVKSLRPTSRPIMEAAKNLAATGVQVDFEELSKIATIVSEFHANAKAGTTAPDR